MKRFSVVLFALIVGAALFFAGRRCGREDADGDGGRQSVVVRVDTLVVRDTIREAVPVPVERRIVRTDTVFVRAAGDTVFVEVPFERKVYKTDDYRAVVEGFHPALVEMELYRPTVYIDREIRSAALPSRSKRWGLGVHAGYGITTKGTAPYVGVGVQYNIIAW